MLASLFSSPVLKVTVSEDIVFLHPIDGDYPVSSRSTYSLASHSLTLMISRRRRTRY